MDEHDGKKVRIDICCAVPMIENAAYKCSGVQEEHVFDEKDIKVKGLKITEHPQPVNIFEGGDNTAQFNVSFENTEDSGLKLLSTWTLDGETVSDQYVVDHETGSTLTLKEIEPADNNQHALKHPNPRPLMNLLLHILDYLLQNIPKMHMTKL